MGGWRDETEFRGPVRYQTDFGKVTYWISKDVPHYAILREFLRKMQSAQKSVAPESPDLSKIDGVVVKSEVVSEIRGKTSSLTTTLVTVRKEPVADAEFQIPDGYKITGILGD